MNYYQNKRREIVAARDMKTRRIIQTCLALLIWLGVILAIIWNMS